MNTKTRRTGETEETALDRFMTNVFEIRDSLEIIQAAADEHFDTNPDKVNWGDVGTAAHINKQLQDIVAIIRGEER